MYVSSGRLTRNACIILERNLLRKRPLAGTKVEVAWLQGRLVVETDKRSCRMVHFGINDVKHSGSVAIDNRHQTPQTFTNGLDISFITI
jgi:hypothetical protein